MAEEEKTAEKQSEVTQESAEQASSPKKEVKKNQPNNLVSEGKIRAPVSLMFTLISAFSVGGLVTFGVWVLLTYSPWFIEKTSSTNPDDTTTQLEEQEILKSEQQYISYNSPNSPATQGSPQTLLGKEAISNYEQEQRYDNTYDQRQEVSPISEEPRRKEEETTSNSFSEFDLNNSESEITPTDVAEKIINLQEITTEPTNVKWSEFSKRLLSLEQERTSIIAILSQKVPRTLKKEKPTPRRKYTLRSETKISPLDPPPAKITWRHVVKELIELEVQRGKTLKQIYANNI